MAGAFGYDATSYATSMAIGELGLLPAVRAADWNTTIVTGETSRRHQIADDTARQARHLATVLKQALS